MPTPAVTVPGRVLVDLSDDLDRCAEELTFIGAAIGADLNANSGAHYLIQGIRDKLAALSQQVMISLREEGATHG